MALLAGSAWMPSWVFAQASPFLTGANALQTNVYAWLTPLAIIGVIVVALLFMFGRLSMTAAAGVLLGIAVGFGAPQIVTWVRGMFAV
jgi:type IV secretion system protein VirB2